MFSLHIRRHYGFPQEVFGRYGRVCCVLVRFAVFFSMPADNPLETFVNFWLRLRSQLFAFAVTLVLSRPCFGVFAWHG